MMDLTFVHLPSLYDGFDICLSFLTGATIKEMQWITLQTSQGLLMVTCLWHRSILDNLAGNGNVTYGISNGLGTVPGEHPYGEHPSRTLFVRNINSNVEDSELRELFEVMMCRCLFSILHGYLLGYLSFFQGIFSIMVSL